VSLVLDSATDWISAGAALLQALAIVVGGVWAYYKFARGQPFAPRAEVRVHGKLLTSDRTRGIIVAATLHNPGETQLPIRAPSVTAEAVVREGWGAPPRWKEVGFAPIFEDHHWLEARETVTDETVIPLPERDGTANGEFLAYRVECSVFEARTHGDGGHRWSSSAIVPGTLGPYSDAPAVRAAGVDVP
jgi:hypothetical protein